MPLGIGWQELVIILVIILVIFGPKRLPEIGRSLGKGIREFKKSTTEIQEQLTGEEKSAKVEKAEAEAEPAAAPEPKKAPEASSPEAKTS